MRIPASLAVTVSAALHAAALALAARAPRPVPAQDVPVEIDEAAPPPAPAPEPPEPAPEPARAPVRRATPAPRHAPPAPAPAAAPPPPNAPPPEDAPPPSKAPVRIGISMSSSTVGGVAAPAGNTLYGEMPRVAPDPGAVRPYRAERYVPPTQVTTLPRPVGECRPPKDEYPEEARRLGVEGVVVLVLVVDETGAIADARVVEDPGHGLGAAAVRSVRRHCRFEAGRRGADPVATTIRYRFRWELD